MPSTEILKERIAILSPEYNQFLSSGFLEQTGELFAENMEFSDIQTAVFENGLTLFFLLFFSRAEWTEFIATECELSYSVAKEIVQTILGELPDVFVEQISQNYRALNEVANGHDLTSDIAETQAALQQIQPMRTMQSDYQQSHIQSNTDDTVHRSTQDDILKSKEQEAASAPRWESEQS